MRETLQQVFFTNVATCSKQPKSCLLSLTTSGRQHPDLISLKVITAQIKGQATAMIAVSQQGLIMDTATKMLERVVGGAECAAVTISVEADAWDMSVFTTLVGMLGQAKVDGIALRFQADLQNRFPDLDNRESLGRDAHTVASTSGMLGFASLSAASRTLERACAHGDDFATSLADLLQCRQTARDLLSRHFRSH